MSDSASIADARRRNGLHARFPYDRGTFFDVQVPVIGDITVRRLLNHTSGLQSVGVPHRAIPAITETDSVADCVPKPARVPLDYQSGAASNEQFDALLQQRLFCPLGMKDSGFGMQLRHLMDSIVN